MATVPERSLLREETPNPFEGLEAQGELNRLLDDLFGGSGEDLQHDDGGRGRRHAEGQGTTRHRTQLSSTGVGARTR